MLLSHRLYSRKNKRYVNCAFLLLPHIRLAVLGFRDRVINFNLSCNIESYVCISKAVSHFRATCHCPFFFSRTSAYHSYAKPKIHLKIKKLKRDLCRCSSKSMSNDESLNSLLVPTNNITWDLRTPTNFTQMTIAC